MKPSTKKTIASIAMGVSGYYVIQAAFTTLPKLPQIITNPLVQQISILTVAGALTLYTVVMMWTDY